MYCSITTEFIYLLEAADLSVADHTVTNILQDVGEIAQESVNEWALKYFNMQYMWKRISSKKKEYENKISHDTLLLPMNHLAYIIYHDRQFWWISAIDTQ